MTLTGSDHTLKWALGSIGSCIFGTIEKVYRLSHKGDIIFMTIKKWAYLFRTTLLAGIVTALVVGFAVEWYNGISYGEQWVVELFYSLLGKLWMGALFSVVASLGFFAFSVLNILLLSIFKNSRLFQAVLWLLLAFTFFDVIYLRYAFFGASNETFVPYVWLPLAVLVIAVGVAWKKATATNRKAFASTVFFMFVFTFIELIPVLKGNNANSLWIALTTLLTCNTWQIMQLHRLLPATKQQSQAVQQKV